MAAKPKPAEEHVEHHRDGSVWAKGPLTAGVPDGYWEWFRKDGTKLRSGHFTHGEQAGEWITYDQQGQPYKVTQIKAKKATASSRPKIKSSR
jgi:antitoxin component YwqK of YwqJK toxin-antitoxin module